MIMAMDGQLQNLLQLQVLKFLLAHGFLYVTQFSCSFSVLASLLTLWKCILLQMTLYCFRHWISLRPAYGVESLMNHACKSWSFVTVIYLFCLLCLWVKCVILHCRLPDGSLMEITKVYPLDAVFDSPEDVPEDVRNPFLTFWSQIFLFVFAFCKLICTMMQIKANKRYAGSSNWTVKVMP